MRWLLIAIVTVLAPVTGTDAKELVDAIHIVETGGRTGPIKGDGGAALGPLQIHKACWIDANMPDGSYADCADLEYAKRVFARYLARYATERRLGRPVTDEDRARIWNGGPRAVWAKGQKKKNLDRYWAKVRKELND